MLPRFSKSCAILIVALAVTLLAASFASACPTCKEGLDANDPEHAGMVQGYFYSILFMMSMPYILLSAFGFYMYQLVKKARRQKEAQAQAASLTSEQQPQQAFSGEPTQVQNAELLEV